MEIYSWIAQGRENPNVPGAGKAVLLTGTSETLINGGEHGSPLPRLGQNKPWEMRQTNWAIEINQKLTSRWTRVSAE